MKIEANSRKSFTWQVMDPWTSTIAPEMRRHQRESQFEVFGGGLEGGGLTTIAALLRKLGSTARSKPPALETQTN